MTWTRRDDPLRNYTEGISSLRMFHVSLLSRQQLFYAFFIMIVLMLVYIYILFHFNLIPYVLYYRDLLCFFIRFLIESNISLQVNTIFYGHQ